MIEVHKSFAQFDFFANNEVNNQFSTVTSQSMALENAVC
jgi:hypothetical protein